MNNVFSKLGGDIIKNNNKIINNENNVNLINKIRNKSQVKPVRNNNNIHLINKNNIPSNNKYNSPSSNIQGIIDNLIQATKSKALGLEGNDNTSNNYKPSLFNAGLLLLTKDNQNVNVNNPQVQNIKNIENNKEENKMQLTEDDFEIHFKYWEILLTMELHAENKLGLHSQVRKFLDLTEKNFVINKEKCY